VRARHYYDQYHPHETLFVIVPVNKEDNLKDEDRLLRWEVLFQHICLPLFYAKDPKIVVRKKQSMARRRKHSFLHQQHKTEHSMLPLSCDTDCVLNRKKKFSYDTQWVWLKYRHE